MVAGVVAILAMPIIVPHLLHGFHIAHIFLHVGGITLAVFIAILAGIAYLRLRTKRLLLSAAAFANFIGAEVILLVDATWPSLHDFGDIPLSEVGTFIDICYTWIIGLGSI